MIARENVIFGPTLSHREGASERGRQERKTDSGSLPQRAIKRNYGK